MRKFALFAASAAVTLAGAGSTFAAVVDGTRDVAYGTALATQANATGFGDNSAADGISANGSELDAAYAQVTGGRLYLFFAGNLQTNGNHLNIYLDTNAGGVSSVTTNTLTFDTGFTADRLIDINGDTNGLYVDYGNYNNTALNSYVGRFTNTGARVANDNGTGTPDLQLAFNNSNVLGVTGDQTTTTAAAALAVTTGIEISIPLADLGITGTSIKVAALINGGGNGYLSNQTLGTLAAGTSNLTGGPVDLNTFTGNQYFNVAVPEPTSLAVLGLGAVGLLRRRK